MDDFIEITEINDSDFGSGGGGGGGGSRGVNFGGGLEYLMNDKVKSGKSKAMTSDLDDLDNLEFELDHLAEDIPMPSASDFFSGSGSGGFGSNEGKPDTSHFNVNVNRTLGDATADASFSDNKTWDGFSKLNTPINPDKPYVPPEARMSKEDLLMEKFRLLKKIETLEKKGVEFSKKYNMESSLSEMQGEYDSIVEEKAKQTSIKFQANMMLSFVNGIEYLNGKFDPFDVNLDGWSEQVNDNINDYDDIFGELYDMYKDKAQVSPWIRLLFQLGGSGLMVHMTNTMFKSAMPNMDDVLRQNPDLMRQFQTAAVNSMGQSNPGFGGFMNGVMNGNMGMGGGGGGGGGGGNGGNGGSGNNGYTTSSPPHNNDFAAHSRGGNNVYGAMNSQSSNFTMPPPPPHNPHSENYRASREPPRPSAPAGRPEMKGPSDINDILSGLKTKTVNVSTQPPPAVATPKAININDSSTISVSDIADLQSEGNAPKKSKRRPRSDKNSTLSLAL
jgi:hypothetical protein